MHPAIRILLLLVFATALPLLALGDLIIAAAALGAALAVIPRPEWSALGRSIWRLRWLLVAVLVLCAGFTPGEPLWHPLPGLSREGLAEGLRRVLVLAVLVTGVQLLLALTPLPGLAQGVGWLAAGLRRAGLDSARFSSRLAAALHGVPGAEALLTQARARPAASLAEAASQAIAALEAAALAQPAPEPAPAGPGPRWYEWLWPVGLAAALHGLAA